MESLELWAREALECCNQSLIGHSGGNLGDKKVKKNADSGGPRSGGLTGTKALSGTGPSEPFMLYTGKESGLILPLS